ncbi:MAG: universal stress protein [Candidatus Obscuribacterales bacterium]|nr:universal stress protein [Candidatus Obscuribacterales bacterium]
MKVLIAVDDEAFGAAIADYVINHQWPPRTEFKVVNVLEPILLDDSREITFLPLLESDVKLIRRQAKALVRHTALRMRTALKTTHIEEVVLEGHPKEEILKLAKEWPADMIFVGSHGRRGVSQFILGSVSTSILQNALCTVTVVRLPKIKAKKVKVAKTREEMLI